MKGFNVGDSVVVNHKTVKEEWFHSDKVFSEPGEIVSEIVQTNGTLGTIYAVTWDGLGEQVSELDLLPV